MTAPDPSAANLDDATLEALLGDVTEIDNATDTPPADWKPPTWAEHKAIQDKLQRANNSAKNLRLKLRGNPSPGAVPPKPGSPAATPPAQGDPAPVDAAKLRAEIEAEFKTKQDAAAVQSAAVTALVAAGLKLPTENRTAAARRAIKLLDLDGVTPDDTTAIDAAIDAAKAMYPGLFTDAGGSPANGTPVRAHTRRLGGPGAAAGTGTGGKAKTAAEQLAESIFGTSS